MKKRMISGRFILVLFAVVGSFCEVSPRHPGTLWLCRAVLVGIVAKVVLDRLVADREQVGNDRICNAKCLHCGYDLRETPLRCPECGEDARQALDEYVPDKLV